MNGFKIWKVEYFITISSFKTCSTEIYIKIPDQPYRKQSLTQFTLKHNIHKQNKLP